MLGEVDGPSSLLEQLLRWLLDPLCFRGCVFRLSTISTLFSESVEPQVRFRAFEVRQVKPGSALTSVHRIDLHQDGSENRT